MENLLFLIYQNFNDKALSTLLLSKELRAKNTILLMSIFRSHPLTKCNFIENISSINVPYEITYLTQLSPTRLATGNYYDSKATIWKIEPDLRTPKLLTTITNKDFDFMIFRLYLTEK